MSSTTKKSPFGAYDIRGVYGDNLTEEFAKKLGGALFEHIGIGNGRFVIGHDVRTSSPVLAGALAEGICAAGGQVTMLGVASTPRLYWHGAAENFDCSIAVTASHLPSKHNGFKICRQNAVPISSEDGLLDIEGAIRDSSSSAGSGRQAKSDLGVVPSFVEDLIGFKKYVAMLGQFLNLSRPLKIVVDAGGSPIGREIESLFGQTKVTVVPLGFEEDAEFKRRSPNPIDEGALLELSEVVIREGANFGAAFDGDGDRVVFVDETGVLIDPDLVTALLAARVLSTRPGATIMYDLRSSRTVKDSIIACGGTALKCRVGHSFIKADMRKQNVALAGELSAHYYWDDLFYTDNAVRALIEVANLLSQRAVTLSSLVEPLKRHVGTGEINFKTSEGRSIIELLKTKFKNANIDYTDGLTVEADDWWFNVRTSQTEPLVRLCVGASDSACLNERRAQLEDLILDAINSSSTVQAR